jgi:Family of unknown function (DUF5995)
MTAAQQPTFGSTIGALDQVVERARQRHERTGFFAALYRGVTVEMATRARAGHFEDPIRIERFTSGFARRYLDADRAWCDGEPTSASWTVAFASARRWRPVVLQHLVVGMNAHINLDLGIAAAELSDGSGLAGVALDFRMINEILDSLVDRAQDSVARVSPWFGLADRAGARSDELLVRFSIRRARDQAWRFAQRLAPMAPSERTVEIERVDRAVAAVARQVLHPGIRLSAPLLVVRLREPWRVGPVLDALSS